MRRLIDEGMKPELAQAEVLENLAPTVVVLDAGSEDPGDPLR